MRKLAALLAAALGLAVLTGIGTASAGAPHFIGNATGIVATTADSVTVAFKEAGLGDEAGVHVVLTATAQCVNPGGNKPQAANKQTVTAAGDYPVQNGRAEGQLTVTAAFQPDCSPPMSVVLSDLRLVDETSGAVANLR